MSEIVSVRGNYRQVADIIGRGALVGLARFQNVPRKMPSTVDESMTYSVVHRLYTYFGLQYSVFKVRQNSRKLGMVKNANKVYNRP